MESQHGEPESISNNATAQPAVDVLRLAHSGIASYLLYGRPIPMTIRCRDRKAYKQGRIVLDSVISQCLDQRNHDQRPQKTAEQIQAILAYRSAQPIH